MKSIFQFILMFSIFSLICIGNSEADDSFPPVKSVSSTRLRHQRQNKSSRIKSCNTNCSNLTLETSNHDCVGFNMNGTRLNDCTRNANSTFHDCRPRRRNGHILNCRRHRNRTGKSRNTKVLCNMHMFDVRSIESIQDGVTVNASAWPWHATIFRHSENSPPKTNSTPVFVCSGTLIGTSRIITAAHCVTDKFGRKFPIEAYEIVLGADYSTFWDARQQDSSQMLKVKSINICSDYNAFTYDSDIAVISIQNVELTRFVYPICTPSKGETNGSAENFFSKGLSSPIIGVTTGFGINQFFGVSNKLKQAIIPLVDKSTCENVSGQIISEAQFCGGNIHSGTLICQGNSGAGIFAWQTKNSSHGYFMLQGIVSHAAYPIVLTNSGGSARCNPKTYTVFTKLTHFLDWIKTRSKLKLMTSASFK